LSETSEALARLSFQFKNSTKLQQTLSAFLQEFDDLLTVGNDLEYNRTIDTAEGSQLDGIGEIVGIERPMIQAALEGIFGFDGDPTAEGFGTLLDEDLGGRWFSGLSYIPIADVYYRPLIKAKIIINTTAMVVDDTTQMLAGMFTTKVKYVLNDTFDVTYYLQKELSSIEVTLLDYLPILIGGGTVTYIDNTPLAWILIDGSWDDGGLWVDAETWID